MSVDSPNNKIKSMIMFPNGDFAAINQHSEQVPEMQARGALELWAEYAAASGFDVDGCKFTTHRGTGVLKKSFDGFDVVWDEASPLEWPKR